MDPVSLIILILVFIGFFTVLSLAVKIVPEYQRLVVFRLGRALGAKGPGLLLLIPFVDKGVRVDLRERFFDVEP
ncbi:MAG: hypothetical protein EHM41_07295, partial [Chloroflexi bacterium]